MSWLTYVYTVTKHQQFNSYHACLLWLIKSQHLSICRDGIWYGLVFEFSLSLLNNVYIRFGFAFIYSYARNICWASFILLRWFFQSLCVRICFVENRDMSKLFVIWRKALTYFQLNEDSFTKSSHLCWWITLILNIEVRNDHVKYLCALMTNTLFSSFLFSFLKFYGRTIKTSVCFLYTFYYIYMYVQFK